MIEPNKYSSVETKCLVGNTEIIEIENKFLFNSKEYISNGIRMPIRGSTDIQFIEGSLTGDMKESGLSIDFYEYKGKLIGGCIDRDETIYLRDFLNKCINIWENESSRG
jgi:hypothetical protein